MPELLNLLSRLLESPGTLITADDFGAMDEGLRGVLVELNVLTPARTAKHVACDGCYEGHVEEVSRVPVAGRKPGFFIRCPEAGWVSVHPDRLRQWKMNLNQVAALLATAIDKNSAAETIVPNTAWRLGEITVAGAAYGVALVAVGETRLSDLLPRLGQSCPHDKTVLVIGGVIPDERPKFAAVLALPSAFQFDGTAFQLAAARVRSSLRTDMGTLANTFRLRGHFWEATFDGHTVHLKDTVGMTYLARMLAEPDKQIPAVSLLAARAGIDPLVTTGSTGEILDKEARDDYERRYVELREELATAEENNDSAMTDTLRAEWDQLATQLSNAIGIGGRPRKGTDVDRVRKSVSMAVTRAIDDITAQHPSFGRHLVAAISSGLMFQYTPPSPTDWLT